MGIRVPRKLSATKANHKMITKMIGAKGIQCSMGGDIEYTNVNGTVKTMSCPVSIENFIGYMNQTIYGLNYPVPMALLIRHGVD